MSDLRAEIAQAVRFKAEVEKLFDSELNRASLNGGIPLALVRVSTTLGFTKGRIETLERWAAENESCYPKEPK